MKIDRTLIELFIPALIAMILCMAYPFVVPENRTYTFEQPEFLTYVDKLSIFTMQDDSALAHKDIKDVFRHEWTLPMAAMYMNQETPAAEKVKISMIVDAGSQSFCVINGRRMRVHDKTDLFEITSIGQNQVTIMFKNGTRETHHVKVY